MCTWLTKICALQSELARKANALTAVQSAVRNLEPKASLSVKPPARPQSRQLQEFPPWPGEAGEARPSWVNSGPVNATVWGSRGTASQFGQAEQMSLFLRLWYNTSTLILFGPSNPRLTWDYNKNVCLNVGCDIHYEPACAKSWSESEFGLKADPRWCHCLRTPVVTRSR